MVCPESENNFVEAKCNPELEVTQGIRVSKQFHCFRIPIIIGAQKYLDNHTMSLMSMQGLITLTSLHEFCV